MGTTETPILPSLWETLQKGTKVRVEKKGDIIVIGRLGSPHPMSDAGYFNLGGTGDPFYISKESVEHLYVIEPPEDPAVEVLAVALFFEYDSHAGLTWGNASPSAKWRWKRDARLFLRKIDEARA